MKIAIHTQSIGPRHDPYDRTILVVTADNGNVAERTECALAGDSIRLLSADGHVLREFKLRKQWLGATPESARCDKTKASILFRRHVGIDPDAAEQQDQEAESRAWDQATRDMTSEQYRSFCYWQNPANFI